MSIEIKMPALSPTMEEGTLARWLVKEGDTVRSGDIMAEIETDKATMEFEAVDEGIIARIVVAEGSDGVKVGAVIAILAEEGEDAAAAASEAPAANATPVAAAPAAATPVVRTEASAEDHGLPADAGAEPAHGDRVKASPLARRLAAAQGLDLATITGSGPKGRIVRADLAGAAPAAKVHEAKATVPAPTQAAKVGAPPPPPPPPPPPAPKPATVPDIPHEAVKLSNMRKTIARRLTESKQTVPHIYLTVDVRLDALLALRAELNASLAARGIKLSVNDLLIKALGVALIEVPQCNVQFAGDQLLTFQRVDISVAVSVPGGLMTPVVTGADTASVSSIAATMKDLATRARDGKLRPEEYSGGTASLSNMGMYGITQFDAVINPPQAMILAVGAGEKRAVVTGDALAVATVMSATGSFDHRAIDGADAAILMKTFRELVERPLGLLA